METSEQECEAAIGPASTEIRDLSHDKDLVTRRRLCDAQMPAVVEELRAVAAAEQGPDLRAVRFVVDYLLGRHGSLELDLAAVGEACGLTDEQVGDVVAGLGTFIARSTRVQYGRAVQPHRARRPTVQEYVSRTGAQPANQDVVDGEVELPMHTDSDVIIPVGWQRSACGRELDRSIAAVVRADPDDELIRRWIQREWPQLHVEMSFEVFSLVWCLSQLGRSNELLELVVVGGKPNPSFANVLADTWDALDDSRAVAVQLVSRIAATHSGDAQQILDMVDECRWLAEAELNRVELAALEQQRGGRQDDLDAELQDLQRLVVTQPQRLQPQMVADLNAGQVRRLSERLGLPVEPGDGDRRKARQLIRSAGFALDIDQLMGLGAAAVMAGLESLFVEALDARRLGNPDWYCELTSALEERSVGWVRGESIDSD